MKRLSLLVLCCMLLNGVAMADAVTQDGELSGVMLWPEGAAQADVVFTYTYSYPHFTPDSDTANTVNEVFAYLVEDAEAFAMPMTGETIPEGETAQTTVTSEITCSNDEYLSVLVKTASNASGEDTEAWSAVNFILTGGRDGVATSLPRVMGILKDEETDEYMLNRQTVKCDNLVRNLIWEAIQADDSHTYFDFLTYEDLMYSFYPEEDFYIADNSDLVFFIQPGVFADASEGILTFRYSLAELRDEL